MWSVNASCAPTKQTSTATVSDEKPNLVQESRDHFRDGDLDQAFHTVHRQLLIDPNDATALFLVAEIEASRGNSAEAIRIAKSIPKGSGQRRASTTLVYEQALKVGDDDSMEWALETLAGATSAWKDRYWEFLSTRGRRLQASMIADQLCRSGDIRPECLCSLIRRGAAYPLFDTIELKIDPKQDFLSELAQSRWRLARGEYVRALKMISNAPPSSHASHALRGRILAESQDFKAVPNWYRSAEPGIAVHSDYWVALGIYFLHRRAMAASTHCFLQAIQRDPTDRQSYRRLSKTLRSLDRYEEAEQFENYAILLVNSESLLEKHLKNPSNPGPRKRMAEKLMELGRPFEALQWSKPLLRPAQRLGIARKRRELLAINDFDELQAEDRMFRLDPSDFEFDPASKMPVQPIATSIVQDGPKARPAEINANPKLQNVASSVGINFQWLHDSELDPRHLFIHETIGGGIAVIDFDRDGWPDLYFCQGASSAPDFQTNASNRMYRNQGGRFADITHHSGTRDTGYATGIASGDVNQDGFPDIFLGNLGENRVLLNNGDGTFRVTQRESLRKKLFTASVAIADLDGDALPDLYESNYLDTEHLFDPVVLTPGQKFVPRSVLEFFAQPDRWFHSNGDGSFSVALIDESVAKAGSSLGIAISDFDGDGTNEVFVGNDGRPNHFLHMEGARVHNLADVQGNSLSFNGVASACMGIATGDFDRSGTMDMFVNNFIRESSNLFLQNDEGVFSDVAVRYGLSEPTQPYVGFGAKANDLDRNGWLDLVLSNGHIEDLRSEGDPFQMPPQVLMSNGRQFSEANLSDPSGYWEGDYVGRTIAMLDFDRDHRMDFVFNHLDAPVAVLKNLTTTNGSWVQLQLVGTESERDAIGAHVHIQTDTGEFHEWVVAGDGYLCTDEPVLDFGLGKSLRILSITISWPSGRTQSFESVKLQKRYWVVEGETQLWQQSPYRSDASQWSGSGPSR